MTDISNKEMMTRHCLPEPEIPFSREEYAKRLERIRAAMEVAKVDMLFVSSPEGLYYVSDFLTNWHLTQSPTI